MLEGQLRPRLVGGAYAGREAPADAWSDRQARRLSALWRGGWACTRQLRAFVDRAAAHEARYSGASVVELGQAARRLRHEAGCPRIGTAWWADAFALGR